MPKKIGVVLAGCGVSDGAEIVCLAPNKDQHDVVNHLSGEPAKEKRNVLIEAARIARGKITDIAKVKAGDLDGLVIPGGYGSAKNLCNFAVKGADCTVDPELERLLKEMNAAKKVLGFICIAPAIAAKVFGGKGVELTIGSDAGTAAALQKMGAKHVNRKVDEIHFDEKNKILSTPAYMLGPSIAHVAKGIEKLVANLYELA
jgi:enhancing lycopene biosynthesis protein 2